MFDHAPSPLHPQNHTHNSCMQSVRSFLFSIISSLLVRSKMSGKPRNRRQKVVIVGGGITGSLLARELSSKLNRKEYELVLIEAKPYAIWLIAGARLVTEGDCHSGLEKRAFVPYDKLFHNGNGSVMRGKVVSIHTDTRGDEPDGGEVDTRSAIGGPEKQTGQDGHNGYVVLEDGEKVPYDALVLATGSKHSGPVDFPDDPAQCVAHIERWRTAFKEAKDVALVGGGGVAIGSCSVVPPLWPPADTYLRAGRGTQGLLSCLPQPSILPWVGTNRCVQEKKVVIVHGRNLLLNDQFPDNFRKLVHQKLEARGVELVLGDYVATFPENGGGEIVFRSGNKLQADLVVRTPVSAAISSLSLTRPCGLFPRFQRMDLNQTPLGFPKLLARIRSHPVVS